MATFNLKGKTAIITGASSGLGEQFALGLAESGADVVLAARRMELLQKIASTIEETYGTSAVPVKTDVREEKEIISLIETTESRFGKIDILVNNAGVYVVKPLTEQTLEDWRKVMDVNLTSAFLASREAARIMIPKKAGTIINTSSTFGLGATEFTEIGYYASKGGIIAMTKALAVELGKHNIRVNAIAPGFFPTAMSADAFKDDDIRERVIRPRTALPMFAQNEWIRGAVCFLASDEARYITGHTLAVDGGWLAY